MKLTHPRRRPKSAPGQYSLALTRQQKFALLRGANFRLPGSKVRTFSRVYELLEQIEIHTGLKGCRVRIGLLAEKMHCSKATVMRATKLAEQLGVVGVGRDRDGENEYRRTGGNGPNWYKVFWDKVRLYCSKETIAIAQQDRPAEQPTEGEQKKQTETREVRTDRTGATGDGWNRVRGELREFGVVNAVTAVNQAWTNGLSPADCLALLAHAGERPAGYWNDPPGVLYHRIINARPGAGPDQDWPKPSSKFLLQEKRDREKQREQSERQRAEIVSANSKSVSDLRIRSEAEFGPLLDAMDPDERNELARRQFGGGPLWQIYQRDGFGSGLVRVSLIAALRKERNRESCPQ
jgi:hypothetical protein